MDDVDDVAVVVAEHAGDAGKRAGQIGHLHGHPHKPAGAYETALENGREDHHVDIAAGQDQSRLAGRERRFGAHRGQRRGAGPFGDRLLDLEQREHGVFDVLLGDGDHPVDPFADDGHGQPPRTFHGDPLRHRSGPRLGGFASVEERCRGGEPLRLNADDGDRRPQRLDGDGDARDQSAAADGDDDRVEVGGLLQHLQPQRALAGDDVRVVERMDQNASALRRQTLREVEGRRQALALQQHFGPEDAGLLHLGVRRRARHHDGDRDAEPPTMVGERLRVVACGHGDNARLPRRRREQQQPVQRAPLLERRGELLVLELEVDVRRQLRGQRLRLGKRRAQNSVADPGVGGADVVERDGHAASFNPTIHAQTRPYLRS